MERIRRKGRKEGGRAGEAKTAEGEWRSKRRGKTAAESAAEDGGREGGGRRGRLSGTM